MLFWEVVGGIILLLLGIAAAIGAIFGYILLLGWASNKSRLLFWILVAAAIFGVICAIAGFTVFMCETDPRAACT